MLSVLLCYKSATESPFALYLFWMPIMYHDLHLFIWTIHFHWYRFPRKVVTAQTLEVFQASLDGALGNLACGRELKLHFNIPSNWNHSWFNDVPGVFSVGGGGRVGGVRKISSCPADLTTHASRIYANGRSMKRNTNYKKLSQFSS